MGVASVAIQFTIIDLLSRGVDKIKGRMQSLAKANKDVQHSFDRMAKSGKYAAYAGVATAAMVKGLRPAVTVSASLQEATLRVKGNLAGSAKDAADLARQLRVVNKTAIEASANAPLSAEGVIDIENALLKAGVPLEDVAGKAGAAFAATVLTSLTGEAPAMIGEALANVGSQFDLKGGAYGDLADWLVRVDDASATNIPALVQGLRMAGSTAKQLKVPVKDTVTALGALSPLGERAGSSFNNMLLGFTKNNAFFADGKFIGMKKSVALLKKEIGGIADDQKRLVLLTKLFGEEGARAAGIFIDAKKGFGEIEDDANKALSAAEKLDIWAEGFNASMAKLRGTSSTTLAVYFKPILAPLSAVVNKTNEWVAALGMAAQQNESIAKTVSNLSLGAVATGGLATLGFGAGALYYGRKVLKGVGGFKGLLGKATSASAGIAAGKAVEAATGVQPVYVTNWPDGYMPGGGIGTGIKTAGTMAVGGAGAFSAAAVAPLVPVVVTAAVAAVSAKIGMTLARQEAKGTSTKELQTLRSRQMVMGGGLDSFQVRTIDQELLRRGVSGLFASHDGLVKNDIKLEIHIDENDRVTTKTNDMATTADVAPVKRGDLL